jgi:hypothetical protein
MKIICGSVLNAKWRPREREHRHEKISNLFLEQKTGLGRGGLLHNYKRCDLQQPFETIQGGLRGKEMTAARKFGEKGGVDREV